MFSAISKIFYQSTSSVDLKQQMDGVMAYLTQYSSNIPVIKFHIDQLVMTIGQDFDMDICVPEDGLADNHATVEAVEQSGMYRFIVKSHENESPLDLNGETTSTAELKNGDWLVIGGVEFQFTDDGVNAIKESNTKISVEKKVTPKPIVVENKNNDSAALKLIKELKEELEPMTTKEFIANSRKSRRRLAF